MNTLNGLAETMNNPVTSDKVKPQAPACAAASDAATPPGDEGVNAPADFASTLSEQQNVQPDESALPDMLQALLGEVTAAQPASEEPMHTDDLANVDPQAAYAMAAMGMLPVETPAPTPPTPQATGGASGAHDGAAAMTSAALMAGAGSRLSQREGDVRSLSEGDNTWTDGMATGASLQKDRATLPHTDIQAVLSKLGSGQWAQQDGADVQDVLRTLTQEAGTGQFGLALTQATQDLGSGQTKVVPQEASLPLKGEPKAWQQPLMQALGDRLQLQIAGRSEQAVIKLSPPMLGQVEIAVQQQGGALQVRLSATHSEVVNQLQQVSDGLRQDLVQRQATEVSVQVTSAPKDADMGRMGQGRDGQQGQPDGQTPQQEERQRRPGRALSEADTSGHRASASFAHSMSRVA